MEKNIANFTYSQQKYLGRGSYSKVYEGKNDLTQERVAVKIIDKKLLTAKANFDNVMGEIEVMK
jgi:SNF-related kinase